MATPDRLLLSDAKPDPGPSTDVLAFFALTFLPTAPMWALSALTPVQFMPELPFSAVAVVCPAAAALILTTRRRGAKAALALLKRAVDVRRIRLKRGWAPLILIMPVCGVATFMASRLSGSDIPDPQFSAVTAVALFLLFLVSAMAEELGWSGFAIGPLQARWGALPAALALGGVWAIWHYPALLQAQHPVAWIGWWTLGAVTMRVVMVWLFNNTGHSVFGAAVFHAISNLCWQLYPVHGSDFSPCLNGLALAAVALAAVWGWGPNTLSSWGWRAPAGRAAGG
ncbi:MAG TPA: type II CAAX endopeptidase family protein [Phenylobacterium sp.]|jgi:hypothetical protein|nr:type II CAAX endopeptidase family protein [Phenylobacterium sp.]